MDRIQVEKLAVEMKRRYELFSEEQKLETFQKLINFMSPEGQIALQFAFEMTPNAFPVEQTFANEEGYTHLMYNDGSLDER